MEGIRTSRRALITAAALAVLATACGSSESPGATTTGPTQPPATTTAAITTFATATTTTILTTSTPPQTTTTAVTTPTPSTTVPPPPTTTLPGEPFDMGFPRDGDVVGVIGVSFDDVLNVRNGPGTSFTIVATLDPLASVVTTGRARLLPRSIWWEVRMGDFIGWVSSTFIAYIGGTHDATSEVVIGRGEIPKTESMVALGQLVAEFYASDDPASDIVMSFGPTVGDLGEVAFDVVGLGDDSVRGLRLRVFGTPTDGGEGFSLSTVERTLLCGRGVASDLCV